MISPYIVIVLSVLSKTTCFHNVPAVHSNESEIVSNTNKSTPHIGITYISALDKITNHMEKINESALNITEVWNDLNKGLTETEECITDSPNLVKICNLNEQLGEKIRSKNWKRVVEIMKEHINNRTLLYKQLNRIEEKDDLPLSAAEYGYTSIIRMLLCHGLPINGKYTRNYTMLHEAAWNGQYCAVKMLIMLGADVNVEDIDGSTPLYSAAGSDNTDVVKILIQNGAKVNHREYSGHRNYPIHWTSYHGRDRNMKYLLQNGAHINVSNGNNETALHIAAKRGKLAVVELLLSKGCDVSIKDTDGKTALDLAKDYGYQEIENFLE